MLRRFFGSLFSYLLFTLGVRQSNGEGVVRRNGRPKGRFGESVLLSPLKFSGVLRGKRRNGLSKSALWNDRFQISLKKSDKTASFCKEMSGREVTGRQIFHETFLPMGFWTPPRFLIILPVL